MMTRFVEIGLFENSQGTITCLKMAKVSDDYTAKLIRSEQSAKKPQVVENKGVPQSPTNSEKVPLEEKRTEEKRTDNNNSSGTSSDAPCSVCDGNSSPIEDKSKPWCSHCKGTGKEPPANPDQPSSPKAGSESDSNTDKGVRRTDKPNNYSDEFEWLWKHKPGRIGANPKKKAYSACKARIKSGSSWREMAEGMKRYTVHCQSEGKLNTQYVMQMATFFGPDEHFKEQWSVQQPQAYQAPGSEQTGVDAPIYPSQIKNFSSANQTEEDKQQNEKIRQGLGSLRSQLSGEAK
jgi:hypothetical protein